MRGFGILFGIDAAVAVILLYFFGWGLADGSVSSFNIGLWLAVLAVPAAVLGGALALRSRGRHGMAQLLLLLLAVPAVLVGAILLMLAAMPPSAWH